MFPPMFTFPFLLAVSPWRSGEWRIQLNFGRETDTPDDLLNNDGWGKSGARLALSVDVCITADRSRMEDEYLGNRCDQLQIWNVGTFVSMRGQEEVRFADAGAWRLSPRQTGSEGDANGLRLILDLDDSIQRNDIVVPPQRLYLAANAWRESELDAGKRRMSFIQKSFDEAQEMLDANLSHQSGDRRLDGTNLLDTAAASLDMAGLVKRRDDRRFELKQAQMKLPYKYLSSAGDWPGSDEGLVIQEGVIALVRKTGGFFGSNELAVIGRWTATPIADEYEYYDDDEEKDEEEGAGDSSSRDTSIIG